jgi:hypothetical protein
MATSAGDGINLAITRQEWENMKPFIRSVYIDENKSFPYLANALRIEFGFMPTYAFSTFFSSNLATGRLSADNSTGNDSFLAKLKNGASARTSLDLKDEGL